MLRSIRYGLHAAVLAGLIAAPVVWSTVDRSVNVSVDGKSTSFRTTASNVDEALSEQGLRADGHDLLAPSGSSKITDGMQIVLRRGRLLHLNVDGRAKLVWTTSRTVDGALAALGYGTRDFVSVSRSRRLPLAPTAIAIRTPRTITVVHDGTTETITTTELTVGAMLAEIGLTPGATDKLSVPEATATSQGQVIALQRIGSKSLTRIETVAYRTSRQNDGTLDKGTTRVITQGRVGTLRVTYSVTYVDGVATAQTTVKTVSVTEPRTKVLAVGTKRTVVSRSAGRNAPS